MGIELLPDSTQVLIAGGGPVGLAAAIELGQRGISCVVIEPRTAVSHARPRCKTINVRTMEHLRRWGLAERLRERAPLPISWSQDIVFCTSLAGRELHRFSGVLGLVPEGDRFPEPGQQAPQYVLEELMREALSDSPTCTLVTGLRVVALEQSADTVRTTVLDESGREALIVSDYAVGCEGSHSVVRESIGAAFEGGSALRPNFGMVFRSEDLWRHVRHGPAIHYWVINDVAPAIVGPLDLDGTWFINAIGVERDTGRRDAQRIIEAAVGASVSPEVLSEDPWTAQMRLADPLRSGRVFLAGDAAHLNPPFGGHGLNTGVSDAVDLGWKLAAVLDGWGAAAILDSYEQERRPVQERVLREASENNSVLSTELLADHLDDEGSDGEAARRVAKAQIQQTKAAEFYSLSLVLDIGVEGSPLIVNEGPPPTATRNGGGTQAYAGRRLPHVWLGAGRSLYDELGQGLTVLRIGEDRGSRAGIEAAAAARKIPLKSVDLSSRNLGDRFGAEILLVRPDQHIAWCGDREPEDPGVLLDQVRGY